jgi:hypothetical protein
MIGSLGKDAVAAAESHLSLIQPIIISTAVLSNLSSSNFSLALLTSHNDTTCNTWLLNSGCDFDASDFSHISPLRRTNIANANGVISPVTRTSSGTLSLSLHLSNTLLVLSLSHKLMYIGQLTTDLRYVVLMYSNFCLIQDILIKQIIGTKRGDYIMWTIST